MILGSRDFQLEPTLESGQFFRWRRLEKDGFLIVTHGRIFTVQRDRVMGVPLKFVRRFFSLDHDGAAIAKTLWKHPTLRKALHRYRGLRILRQDPWECLISFMTSVASNIQRITRNLNGLCEALGRPVALDGLSWSAMPPPTELCNEAFLRRLGFGFRAKYLVQTAREVQRGALRGLERATTKEARRRLCELPGVAEKVADCILLFAYGRLEAFPVDTWIRRIMTDLYFGGRRPRGGDETIRAFAADRFGPLAGYAQQYLYTWSRNRHGPDGSICV